MLQYSRVWVLESKVHLTEVGILDTCTHKGVAWLSFDLHVSDIWHDRHSGHHQVCRRQVHSSAESNQSMHDYWCSSWRLPVWLQVSIGVPWLTGSRLGHVDMDVAMLTGLRCMCSHRYTEHRLLALAR